MEDRKVSKKVPIALGIVWLGFVALSYLAVMVFTILEPELYVRMVEEDWRVMLLGVIVCAISALFMAGILTLSEKADLKWLKIVSLIHLLADTVVGLVMGIALLAYL